MNLSDMTLDERIELHKREIMPKYKKKLLPLKSKQIGSGKGTFVEREFFESPAFISLRGVAAQMLIYILGKRKFGGKRGGDRILLNGDQIKLSYIELRKLGITQPRATRGFDELLAKGFIKIIHHGGGCQKDQSIYGLSNQYLLWKKGTIFFKRPNVLKKGFQNASARKS